MKCSEVARYWRRAFEWAGPGLGSWQVGELLGQVLMLTDEGGGGRASAPSTAATGVIILTGVN